MGNHNSKRRKSYHSRGSLSFVGSKVSADSLDLIYIDDYFDDARYLKLVAKKLADKKMHRAGSKSQPKASTTSDTVVWSNRKNRESTTRPVTSSRQSHNAPVTHSSSKKSVNTSRPSTTVKKSVHVISSPPPKELPPSSLSTNDMPHSSEVTVTDKIAQTSSWHGETTSSGVPDGRKSALKATAPTAHNDRASKELTQHSTLHHTPPVIALEQSKNRKPKSILTTTASKPYDEDNNATVRRQRSYVISSTSYKDSTKRSTSVTTDWHPKSVNKDYRPQTTTLQTHPSPRPTSANQQKPKKKLIVRGLRSFVNARNKHRENPPSSVNNNSRKHFSGGGGASRASGPDIWKREFPSKSKFHPDNFIYEWAEGPKAPPRPFSAMAKCKKHGGRCNDCGLFTCDLCQACRKCETDCACPSSRGKKVSCCGSPYTPKEVYSEIFGGDGWNKACKVLCNLTEQDKTHPVGGNASKRKQNCDENWAKNNLYKPQIDVLNPYGVPLNDVPEIIPQPMLQHPMCIPPMFPMSFMPMMAMPPPMMHYYPPPPPLPCASYDPNCVPPSYPYPSSDSFMPVQNYN